MARSGRPRRPLVFERGTVKLGEIREVGCGWRGCRRSFAIGGDLPAGWVRLITYHTPRPEVHPTWVKVKLKDMDRDVALCPEHLRALLEPSTRPRASWRS
jgi:hypothetical protein